jgi:TRAP-type C4-dicarboxylate transport system permease small subunit|tara:strand:+ start:374 stop:631 length:258 start_codon:yes stop_codon:yes gene_type:complete
MHIISFFIAAVSTVVGIIIISAIITEGSTKMESIHGVDVPADPISLALAAFFAAFAFICLGNMVRHYKERTRKGDEIAWSDKDNE